MSEEIMQGALVWSDEGRIPLFAAYAKAQAKMGAVVKDSENAHFKTPYATLSSAISAVLPAFNECGIAVIQSPTFDGEALTVETIIIHAEGGWMKSSLNVLPGKPDAQGLGSAITYLRRYGLMALAGVAPEDDDGNAASVTGDGGKKFDRSKPGKSIEQLIADFTADMHKNTTLEAVDAWAAENANAMAERLKGRDMHRMQQAFEAWRIKVSKPNPTSKPLADRAFVLEQAMRACVDQASLRKTYDSAERLRTDLDRGDPERLVEINAIYEELYGAFDAPTTANEVFP